MNQKISQIQTQKQILAPAMRQSISILMLPISDLNLAVEQELLNNPLLEAEETSPSLNELPIESILKKSLDDRQRITDMPDYWFSDDEEQEERPISRDGTLEDSLLNQLRLEISDPTELAIGEHIIGNINEDGYLEVDLNEIAHKFQLSDLSVIEKVLKIIQEFEPIGIASRDLKECLLTQVEARYNGHSELATKIIKEYLNALSKKQHHLIARELRIPLEKVKEAAKLIAKLDPKPARNYRPINMQIYIKPDIIIKKGHDDQFQVITNKKNILRIRINPLYQAMLKNPNLSAKEKNYIREKIQDAITFIKSLDLRGHTINEIGKYLLEKQKGFFEGKEFSIVPMTLKDVAQTIDRNESTICRAISNKYIDTPQGLFPLKFFFSQAVNEENNGAISSRSIKEEILDLINSEDKTKPLSDQAIQNHFATKKIKLARRTINKYRKDLKILPSHLRKE